MTPTHRPKLRDVRLPAAARLPRRNEKRSGMSLLEVLVACGILVIGLASVAAMLPAAASRLSQAGAQDRAVTASEAAMVEVEARQLLSRDLFTSGSAGLVFGFGTTDAASLTSLLSKPAGPGFSQRMDNDPAGDRRMYYVEDEVEYDTGGGTLPLNSFTNGVRRFRRGVCWGAIALPEPWGTGTSTLNAARVSIAVFQKPGALQQFALTQVFPGTAPTSMFQIPSGAGVDDPTRKQFLRPCSFVLAIPPSGSASPRWLSIVSSWPIWDPGADPQKTLPSSFRFTFRDEVPPTMLSGTTLNVIGFANLLGVTEKIMPVY